MKYILKKNQEVTMTEEEKLWTGGIDKKIFWFGRARCVFVSRIYVWQRPKYSCGDQRTSWNRQTDYDWKWCIQNLQEQPLISMNQKYSSYHNLIQCCSDFGFMPNIVLCTMENSLIYRFCQEKIELALTQMFILKKNCWQVFAR